MALKKRKAKEDKAALAEKWRAHNLAKKQTPAITLDWEVLDEGEYQYRWTKYSPTLTIECGHPSRGSWSPDYKRSTIKFSTLEKLNVAWKYINEFWTTPENVRRMATHEQTIG